MTIPDPSPDPIAVCRRNQAICEEHMRSHPDKVGALMGYLDWRTEETIIREQTQESQS